MIELRVRSTGMTDIVTRLDGVAARFRDLFWLAERIAEVLVEQNATARQAGLDKDGDPFAPIKPATAERRRRRGDGDGPPLSPNGPASRITANVRIRVEQVSPGHWRVTLWWEDMPWLHCHVTGTPVMAARDPVGVTPDGQEAIHEAVNQTLAAILNGDL